MQVQHSQPSHKAEPASRHLSPISSPKPPVASSISDKSHRLFVRHSTRPLSLSARQRTLPRSPTADARILCPLPAILRLACSLGSSYLLRLHEQGVDLQGRPAQSTMLYSLRQQPLRAASSTTPPRCCRARAGSDRRPERALGHVAAAVHLARAERSHEPRARQPHRHLLARYRYCTSCWWDSRHSWL